MKLADLLTLHKDVIKGVFKIYKGVTQAKHVQLASGAAFW